MDNTSAHDTCYSLVHIHTGSQKLLRPTTSIDLVQLCARPSDRTNGLLPVSTAEKHLPNDPFSHQLTECSYLGLHLVGFLRQKHRLGVRQQATLGNFHTIQKFVKLLVVVDVQLQVTWDDAGLLVVTTAGIASSKTSAAGYFRTAAKYSETPAPMCSTYLPLRSRRRTRSTGNRRPSREDLVFTLTRVLLAFAATTHAFQRR
ncbi:hypothetical protein CLF_101516 [Clonorchis sinensis]|uniref:Uncharacterized protein n=1 Tax=Clonorchis sinensis TaxID=79923 RepID=G7Y5X8_CLOSI|nr:hypothetical protein CLF_101516 [Clonorchis sinensis]